MRFWDASAVVPLLVHEPDSATLQRLARDDAGVVIWWGTPVECGSAIAGLAREGHLTGRDEDAALALLETLTRASTEVLPTPAVRRTALRLLRVHPLRSADALQLAAALAWAENHVETRELVTRDGRLGEAARREGFVLV